MDSKSVQVFDGLGEEEKNYNWRLALTVETLSSPRCLRWLPFIGINMTDPVQVFDGQGTVEAVQIVVDLYILGDVYEPTAERVQVFKKDYDNLALNPSQETCHDKLQAEYIDAYKLNEGKLAMLGHAVRLPDGSIGCDIVHDLKWSYGDAMPGPMANIDG